MAAYAALVSLLNNMEQIMNHPRLSTSLDKKQIESLGEKLDFLLDFVECYNSNGGVRKEAEDLECQIASAAHAAEDVIESHIVDQIHAGEISSSLLDLLRVIEDMDSIKKKVMEVKEKWGFHEEQPTYSMPAASSLRRLTTMKTTMVGFDDELIQLIDLLTRPQPHRETISIIGMGGMGKTTLARNVYENSLIKPHFDVRAWATVSQEYDVRETLSELLCSQGKSCSKTVEELGEQLHKSLWGRRYLIILDNMWSAELWDAIENFFPNNGKGSRVVVTTRLSNVAIHCGSFGFKMNFLSEVESWNLFCDKAFGHEDCPPKLQEIGKEILKPCQGLPLSIVVVGGVLQKSYRTLKSWRKVVENINSILDLGENKECLNVLYLSYSQLPAYLKPCFLYMGVFQEDYEIRVSRIIKLWVAEGFIKPNGAQVLEEIAEGYLKDLIERNLISIGRLCNNGKIRTCRIHNLLRDLCISVAEKEKFFRVITKAQSIPRGIERDYRLICHDFVANHGSSQLFNALQSASLARSLICRILDKPIKHRLIRVSNTRTIWSDEGTFQNFNLRFLAYNPWKIDSMSELPSSMHLIWNLQTLIANGQPTLIVAPPEIWKMPQLRHVGCNKIYLPDPPRSDEQGDGLCVMENLQSLTKVVNFRLSDEVCKRIPNIKKLRITYDNNLIGYDDCWYKYLDNLGRLNKLESLNIKFVSCWKRLKLEILRLLKRSSAPHNSLNKMFLLKRPLTFPTSLNKLCLTNCGLKWEDMTVIGSLPHLEVLKVKNIVGSEWSPIQREFLCLKFLSIENCKLRVWKADGSHFPVLERLVLQQSWGLEEIPWGIGEIPTLQLIRLIHCSECVAISAMKIKKEQEKLGNDGLQIQLMIPPSSSERFLEMVEMERLSINSIQFEVGILLKFEPDLA